MAGVDDLFATAPKEAPEDDAAGAGTVAETEPASTKKRATAGRFMVLKEMGDQDSETFVIVEHNVEAPNRETAIRTVAQTDDGLIEGRYLAIPLSSAKIISVKQTTKITLF